MTTTEEQTGFCLERAFSSFKTLRSFKRPSQDTLSAAVADLRPLVALVLRDIRLGHDQPVRRDAEELIQNIEGWLVDLLPKMPTTFDVPRQFRAYLTVAIRRRLLVELNTLRRSRGVPPGYRQPDPPRSELDDLEERLYVEDVLASVEHRVHNWLRSPENAALAEGMRYAVHCYLRGEEPSALHLQFNLGIPNPRACLEKARVRLRMELAEIWCRDLAAVRSSDGPVATLFGGAGRRRPTRWALKRNGSPP